MSKASWISYFGSEAYVLCLRVCDATDASDATYAADDDLRCLNPIVWALTVSSAGSAVLQHLNAGLLCCRRGAVLLVSAALCCCWLVQHFIERDCSLKRGECVGIPAACSAAGTPL